MHTRDVMTTHVVFLLGQQNKVIAANLSISPRTIEIIALT